MSIPKSGNDSLCFTFFNISFTTLQFLTATGISLQLVSAAGSRSPPALHRPMGLKQPVDGSGANALTELLYRGLSLSSPLPSTSMNSARNGGQPLRTELPQIIPTARTELSLPHECKYEAAFAGQQPCPPRLGRGWQLFKVMNFRILVLFLGWTIQYLESSDFA